MIETQIIRLTEKDIELLNKNKNLSCEIIVIDCDFCGEEKEIEIHLTQEK